MDKGRSGLDEVELSNLIGDIYDCVIDPGRWEPTLDRLRALLDCAGCALYVTDLRDAAARMQSIVGLEKEWAAQFPEYAADAAAMMSAVPDLMSRGLDEPVVGRRDVPEEVFLSSRYWREWAAPHGIVDFITLNLIRSADRVAGVALGRDERAGLITDREIRLLRIFAPHLRRAVVITDLLDMKGIEAKALGYALDMVPAGVVLVAEDTEILHANRTAERMLADARPIASLDGRLTAPDARAAGELRAAVAAAARSEAEMGSAGIGMALAGNDGQAATAHVLPIAEGALRSRLMPKGAAAVFVASADLQPPINLAAVARLYDLSSAELRILERLMQGESLAEAASALCISQNTAKTHLSRIFAKTGARRQTSLLALINRLVPPAAPSGSGDG
jgi:DNA-binding CsgD family transcriptional regulator/PAS domain-containing protein